MSYLNYRKLEEIKKDFGKSDLEGLSLDQFLKVMLNHLGAEYSDKTKLVKELIELFRQIDVNNDETLEWEKFTKHIIELGRLSLTNGYRDGQEGQDFHRCDQELLRKRDQRHREARH